MKTSLKVIRVPLVLEASNVLLHRVFYGIGLGGGFVDSASLFLSLAIVFYGGWIASRSARPLAAAALAGFLLWLFSTALTAIIMSAAALISANPDGGPAPIAGFMLSSLFLAPAAIVVAVVAAAISVKRTRT